MRGRNFLLDTNIIVPFLNGNETIVKKITELDIVNLPITVVGELFYGASNSGQIQKNTNRINEFIPQCKIYSINTSIASYYGKIKVLLKSQGTPIPENDIWIAAICMENEMTLVSRDKHFKNISKLQIKSW